jgi:plastocyanin
MDLIRFGALTALLIFALYACGEAGSIRRDQPASSNQTSTTNAPPPAADAVVVHEVNATNMGGAFDPATITVRVGTRVRWINASGNIHNVTFEDSSVGHSATMASKDSFEITFKKEGTYKYRCTFHPGMEGTVVVSG